MSNIVKFTQPGSQEWLDIKADRIHTIWNNALFEIGQVLLEVKAALPHGEFIPWIDRYLPFSRHQANDYMRVTRRREEFVEEPTSLKYAVRELRRIDQMGAPAPISNPHPTQYIDSYGQEITSPQRLPPPQTILERTDSYLKVAAKTRDFLIFIQAISLDELDALPMEMRDFIRRDTEALHEYLTVFNKRLLGKPQLRNLNNETK